MTGPLPPDAICYRNGDNTALRWALFLAWKQRCYSCTEPLIFGNTEIDHIIPRTTGDDELRQLIVDHGLDDDFHVDRPANLAPICRRCNGKKSNRNLLRALVTTNLLVDAKTREPEVERRYRAYHSANDVAKGLIEAIKANPYDPDIRQDFLEYGPVIVDILATIDEEKASGFTNLRHLQVGGQHVIIGVDPRARFALRAITDICGDTVEAVIEPALRQLTTELDARADAYVRDKWLTGTIALAEAWHVSMHISDFSRAGTDIVVRILGGFRRDFDVSITETSQNRGRRVVHRPPERIEVGVGFEITACWDLSAPTGTPSDVTIEPREYEIDEIAEVLD